MLLRPADPRTRRKRPALFIATVGTLLAVSLTGCSLSKDQQPTSATQGNSVSGAGFTAQSVVGEPIKVPGGRPTVLLFFSVECGGCGPTANALAKVQADDPTAANFVVVDVAAYETAGDIERFLNGYDASDVGYTIDKDGGLTADYEVTQLSTVLILDADNNVTFRAVEPSADTIRTELAKVTAS
ncbi:TlpA family protein disulfide reductase [Pimelobacter simplex]|uniref:Thioredoxin domain-containing protein n=1 Tax=Nocardioides humi TaxID=449461 RepID=A0ABN2AHM8_9ACTN|nr:alkyl hydroperoxide reductase [Nocardioides humi]